MDEKHKEFDFVGDMTPDEMNPLSKPAQVGLEKLGGDLFRVRGMKAISGIRMKVVDGFLYERDLEVVDFWADLSFERDYKLRTVRSVHDTIGKEGWSMAKVRRDAALAALLSKDWSGKRSERDLGAGKDLGAAAAALFGDVGQSSIKGTTKQLTDSDRLWRIIIRIKFRGDDALLFDVAPRNDEAELGWVSSSDLIVYLWNKKLSKFSPEPFEGGERHAQIVSLAKEHFERLVADKTEGSPGQRFQRARLIYEDRISSQAIEKGRTWKARATAIFDRSGERISLHHIGGAWKVSSGSDEEKSE